jgi:hypothetical protein
MPASAVERRRLLQTLPALREKKQAYIKGLDASDEKLIIKLGAAVKLLTTNMVIFSKMYTRL